MRMRNIKRGKRRLWEKNNMCMVRKKEEEGEEKEEEGEEEEAEMFDILTLGCIGMRKILERF